MSKQALPSRWPQLLSAETLAEYCDLCPRTIEKLRATGHIPKPVQMPGDLRSVRWRRTDIDEFFANLPAEKN